MKKILDIITEKMQQAFTDAGYDASFGRVTVSNRPDLCEYQCNGALAAAKQYKCAPIMIAKAVVEKLNAEDYSLVEAVMPGFINLKLSGAFLQNYLEEMRGAEDFGVEKIGEGKTQEGLIVHSEGDWLKIVVTDEYNKLDAGFGYTVPGANTKVVFTFTVNGLAK